MDKIIDKIVALGVPGLILLIAISTSGLAGGAAIVAALSFLGGPFGLIGGIALIGVLTLISKGIADYGFETIFESSVKTLKEKKGLSNGDIIKEINKYPISKDLKIKLKSYLENLWH